VIIGKNNGTPRSVVTFAAFGPLMRLRNALIVCGCAQRGSAVHRTQQRDIAVALMQSFRSGIHREWIKANDSCRFQVTPTTSKQESKRNDLIKSTNLQNITYDLREVVKCSKNISIGGESNDDNSNDWRQTLREILGIQYIILCYAVLCYVVLCCATLCYAVLRSSAIQYDDVC
jgi:hypothetical protein